MIMKKIHIMLFFTLWMVVTSCFTSYVSHKQVMEVRQGMSRQEVSELLGKPDYRRFEGDMEEWEFKRDAGTPGWSSDPMTIVVQFVGDRVTSMNSFKTWQPPHPPTVVVPPSPVTTVEVVEKREPEVIRLMTDSEFEKFIQKFKFTFMSDDQNKMIDQLLNKHDVTSSQCVSIVNEISYTPDQVEMMKRLYPYVRDKRNFNKVIDILHSNIYKDEIRKFIKEYHQTNK